MIQYRHFQYTKSFITAMLILMLGLTVHAQKDSITYNSTCTNYKIQFSINLRHFLALVLHVIIFSF